jgi:hypothetical protein
MDSCLNILSDSMILRIVSIAAYATILISLINNIRQHEGLMSPLPVLLITVLGLLVCCHAPILEFFYRLLVQVLM